MLSQEDNDRLTLVGPGKPMGELFRRYWIPALLSSELAKNDGAPLRVRLLGEDLLAFRDSMGQIGFRSEARNGSDNDSALIKPPRGITESQRAADRILTRFSEARSLTTMAGSQARRQAVGCTITSAPLRAKTVASSGNTAS